MALKFDSWLDRLIPAAQCSSRSPGLPHVTGRHEGSTAFGSAFRSHAFASNHVLPRLCESHARGAAPAGSANCQAGRAVPRLDVPSLDDAESHKQQAVGSSVAQQSTADGIASVSFIADGVDCYEALRER